MSQELQATAEQRIGTPSHPNVWPGIIVNTGYRQCRGGISDKTVSAARAHFDRPSAALSAAHHRDKRRIGIQDFVRKTAKAPEYSTANAANPASPISVQNP